MEFKQKVSEETFKKKYMLNGEESFDEVFQGIAEEASSVEKNKKVWKDYFYSDISSGRLFPAGRITANARPQNHLKKNLLNCYVIPIEDSIQGITTALQEYMKILSMGGGVGLNFSTLRPKGAPVTNGGETTGPLPFADVFNRASETISLGGGRRGASIMILNADHPDIEDFITYKQGDKLQKFNISVGITDEFMRCVKEDLEWDLIFDRKVYKTIRAKDLYNKIMKNAYMNNEPGIFNLDHVNETNNGSYMYDIAAPNPCAEQPLPEYGACNLGAINLAKFVIDPFTDNARFDFDSYEKTIKHGVRFLDNILDCTKFPLEKIEERVLGERRIGLGFTAFANMLSMLKLKYNSKRAYALTEELARLQRDASYEASALLAKEKGAFPYYKKEYLNGKFIKQLPDHIQSLIKKHGIRNLALNTVAPTGTISLTLGQNCSSGIEPTFSLQYDRTIRIGVDDKSVKETVYDKAWLDYLTFCESEGLTVEGKPDWFSVTHDLSPNDHLKMQGIWQKYIDASISKTINLPKETTFDEYKNIFRKAYDYKVKGTTTFYEGGNLKGILEVSSSYAELKRREDGSLIRPKRVPCDIHEIVVKGKNYLALVGILEEKPYEIFITANLHKKEYPMHSKKKGVIHKVKKGMYNLVIENGEEKIYIEDITNKFDPQQLTFGRLVSMVLRSEKPVQLLVTQLLKDPNFVGFEKAVGRVLKKYIKNGEKSKDSMSCPECGGSNFTYQEGCLQCDLSRGGCGWSKCS